MSKAKRKRAAVSKQRYLIVATVALVILYLGNSEGSVYLTPNIVGNVPLWLSGILLSILGLGLIISSWIQRQAWAKQKRKSISYALIIMGFVSSLLVGDMYGFYNWHIAILVTISTFIIVILQSLSQSDNLSSTGQNHSSETIVRNLSDEAFVRPLANLSDEFVDTDEWHTTTVSHNSKLQLKE